MNRQNFISAIVLFLTTLSFQVSAQDKAPVWSADQLLAPETLATRIGNPGVNAPLIMSVGPSALIKGSVDAGPAHESAGLDKLKQLLAKEPKGRQIIIYCGCCPFDKCPNIRPAFSLLKAMKFTNPQLLNLPHNLKVDWIDKGFPINEN
jgi:hypothetical protein